jgi:hypothetical protein
MSDFDIEKVPFADVQSRRNFHLAKAGERNAMGFLPLVIINGSRPGSGKTALAREILNSRFSSAKVDEMPLSRVAWYGLIFGAKERGYLFLDDIGKLPDNVLQWLVSPGYTLRKLGSKEYSTASARDIQVVITGNNLTVSKALSEFALVIQLG